jgi:asparagine synthase (glutamine-hydrolysing)
MLPLGFTGRNAITGLGGSLADSVRRIGVMFDAQQRRRLVPALRDGALVGQADAWKAAVIEPERGVPGAYMAADFNSYLPGDILVKVDRASMANSLEVRAPFLDQRIVEFAFSRVPNSMRANATDRKILLKRLAAKLLPPQFDAHRKQGFAIPLADWLTPNLRSQWCDRFESLFNSIFDFSAVRPLLKANHVGAVTRLFALLFLMLWMETYGVTA